MRTREVGWSWSAAASNGQLLAVTSRGGIAIEDRATRRGMRDAAALRMQRIATLIWDPRLWRIGLTVLTLVLAACQNNSDGGGGGAPAY